MTDVVGFATSHGPTLSLPPDQWQSRAGVDRQNKGLVFRGAVYDYESLLALRRDEGFSDDMRLESMTHKHDRCNDALGALRACFEDADVSRAIIVGNDHKESFSDECFGAFTVYAGGSIMQVPASPEDVATMQPGSDAARIGHTPPQPASHPGLPDFADELIAHMTENNFDIARSTMLPPGRFGNRNVPHAYGFVYRQIMGDKVVPNVPIFVNTFYPPNLPNAARCVAFGQQLGKFLTSSPVPGRTAVIASGGLSHFVIDVELDQSLLNAMATGDLDRLARFDDVSLSSGTAEARNWIVVAAAMAVLGRKMEIIDYVPCYRTEAGTGTAMCFATWS
jgi:catalytic LigB subunit of aromatic ring-opening dioxygenase